MCCILENIYSNDKLSSTVLVLSSTINSKRAKNKSSRGREKAQRYILVLRGRRDTLLPDPEFKKKVVRFNP
jgi:hypothetical protein